MKSETKNQFPLPCAAKQIPTRSRKDVKTNGRPSFVSRASTLALACQFFVFAPTVDPTVFAQAQTTTAASRSRVQRIAPVPNDLQSISGDQVPRYASWFSLAQPGAPIPCFDVIHRLHPDWAVLYSPSLGTDVVLWMTVRRTRSRPKVSQPS